VVTPHHIYTHQFQCQFPTEYHLAQVRRYTVPEFLHSYKYCMCFPLCCISSYMYLRLTPDGLIPFIPTIYTSEVGLHPWFKFKIYVS
jgi:hypothetical protein